MSRILRIMLYSEYEREYWFNFDDNTYMYRGSGSKFYQFNGIKSSSWYILANNKNELPHYFKIKNYRLI